MKPEHSVIAKPLLRKYYVFLINACRILARYICRMNRKEMDYRISKACELLILTNDSVHAIAYSCGYNDALTFSKAFKKKKGISPLAYRKKELGQ